MRSATILLVLLMNVCLYSQPKLSGVLYVNSNNNVNLFFQSPIIRATVGANNFTFGFDTKVKGKIGILKGAPGPDSNLLIITEDNNIYSFEVKYKKVLDKYDYFIINDNAIGNLDGDQKSSQYIPNTIESDDENTSKTIVENDFYENKDQVEISDSGTSKNDSVSDNLLYEKDKERYMEKFSSNLVSVQPKIKRYVTEKSNVILKLNNLLYNKNELYFYVSIINNSPVDYDVNYIKFFLTAKKNKKKASSQKIEYEPIYRYHVPKRVIGLTENKFVFVFNKFSINQEKTLVMVLNELKGERNLELPITNDIINNPNY